VRSGSKSRWQQVTTLVSLSTCGAMTGFSFAQGAVADMTSPTSLPVHLLALQKPVKPAANGDAALKDRVQRDQAQRDQALRSSIVSVANYYLRMAQHKSPAEMEALIWQQDSVDGADHGESCAAFASLTLALGAQATGHESWVTGGTTYPWPLHAWADVRVDPNPSSLDIVSVLSDAQAHQRWHPLGDGYQPQPGDWVLFDGHVEVVTKYAGGMLSTIGADSLPNLTVNAHQFGGPLGDQGVVGFVDNGNLASPTGPATDSPSAQPSASASAQPSASTSAQPTTTQPGTAQPSGGADVPGIPAVVTGVNGAGTSGSRSSGPGPATAGSGAGTARADAELASVPGIPAASQLRQPTGSPGSGAAAIPGVAPATAQPADEPQAASPPRYSKHQNIPAATQAPGTSTQQAFIDKVAPGAIAAQRKYGIPASVTIAQAIDESGWGQSGLAVKDNNLFGIKGAGPAGADVQETQEYVNGQWVTTTAPFRVYHNVAESIADHSQLLATSGYYQHAMADREVPDAFATDLTGIYATDPEYGSKLIGLMRLYNLYRYDSPAPTPVPHAAPHAAPTGPAATAMPSPAVPPSVPPHPSTSATPTAAPHGPASATPTATPSGAPAAASSAAPSAGLGGASTAAPTGAPYTPSGWTPTEVPHVVPSGGAAIPGVADAYIRPTPAVMAPVAATETADFRPMTPLPAGSAAHAPRQQSKPVRPTRSAPRGARTATRRYVPEMPRSVMNAFVADARAPLIQAEPLYRDVAQTNSVRWELLAACDWMQCRAHPRYSPVYGEKLAMVNPDGTSYRTKSAALMRCASDLIELAGAVYRIDLTMREDLSVPALAKVFAAFRWGGLLKAHNISALEFPYSVAGLTAQHLKMHWPDIDEPNPPDKPGTRFRRAFGAVPVVLSLGYQPIV